MRNFLLYFLKNNVFINFSVHFLQIKPAINLSNSYPHPFRLNNNRAFGLLKTFSKLYFYGRYEMRKRDSINSIISDMSFDEYELNVDRRNIKLFEEKEKPLHKVRQDSL